MAGLGQIYGGVRSKADFEQASQRIRKDVEMASSREALTELYRRAAYLIALSYSPSWEERLGREVAELRQVAVTEFDATARKINLRAREIGTEPSFDERLWQASNTTWPTYL